jgi:hypothetical protein
LFLHKKNTKPHNKPHIKDPVIKYGMVIISKKNIDTDINLASPPPQIPNTKRKNPNIIEINMQIK